MSIRHAAAGGIAAAAAAIAAFLLIPHHMIAGTNTVSRLGPVIGVNPGKDYCERIPSVPSGTGFVRLEAVRANQTVALQARRDFSRLDPITGLGVSLADSRGPIGSGTVSGVDSGRIDVPLRQPTRGAGRAHICVSNLGEEVLSLYGEAKAQADGTSAATLGVTFLDAESSGWLSHPGTILSRFRDGHAGAIGTWALWLACLLVLAASALSVWLMVEQSERR
jgi:hypothetical protein